MRGYLRLVLSTVLFGLPCTSLICQNAPDSAVSLTIRFTGGISQFHVGEKIPIELAFTSSAPETFELNPRNYDRSGRLGWKRPYSRWLAELVGPRPVGE